MEQTSTLNRGAIFEVRFCFAIIFSLARDRVKKGLHQGICECDVWQKFGVDIALLWAIPLT
jgi:hypothetical protein